MTEQVFDHVTASEDAVVHYLAHFSKFKILDNVEEDAASYFNYEIWRHANKTEIDFDEDDWFLHIPVKDVVKIAIQIQSGLRDNWKSANNEKVLKRFTSDEQLLSPMLRYLIGSLKIRHKKEESEDLLAIIIELTELANERCSSFES